MKYFKDVKSLEDLKKQFKKLAMKYHPDRPTGDVEIMKAINNEYDKLFPIWKNRDQVNSSETSYSTREEFYDRQGWRGEKYDSSLSSKDIAKKMREYVKEHYSDCKFSITSTHNTVHITLLEASENAFIDSNMDHIQLNPYWLQEETRLTENIKKMMLDINEELDSYRRDDSDIMTDYFSCNFYRYLDVGTYSKPFKVVYREKKQTKTTKKNTRSKADAKDNSKEVKTSNEFEIVENDAKQGIELYFKGIPDADFRNELKSHGFKWHPSKKCWYAKKTDNIMAFLDSFKDGKKDDTKNNSCSPADIIEQTIKDLGLEPDKDFSYYSKIIKENNINSKDKTDLKRNILRYHIFKYGQPNLSSFMSWCNKYNLDQSKSVTELSQEIADIIYNDIVNSLNGGKLAA